MSRLKSNSKRQSSGRSIDDSVAELDFEDEAIDRIGDELTPAELAENLPPRRQRTGGLSGAELTGDEITDDDLTPETLLDEEEDYDATIETAADKILSIVDGDRIGGGIGKDEAELANAEHPGQ